jgi:transposase-like protein
VSIAAVALANGLNANMVRKWVIEAEARTGTAPVSKTDIPAASSDMPAASVPLHFLPLAVPAPPAPADEIRIELQHGTTAIKVSWPTAVAAECAAWLRELLR